MFERDDELVVVVADGAGGLRGGAMASAAIVDAVEARALHPSTDWRDLRAWMRLVERVDGELSRAASGETTVVIAVVSEDGIVGISAGDSEAWMIDAARTDRLTEAQTKARVGSGRCAPVMFGCGPRRGSLVVATDGLFRHANADAIERCCRSTPDDAPAELVALARLPSGQLADDVSVVVVS